MKNHLERWIIGNVLFPVTSELFNRRGILPKYRELLRSEKLPRKVIKEEQERKLRDLVEYAYRRIPFYRRRFDESGIRPGDIRKVEDLAMIPSLTRQDVIENHHEMVDSRYSHYAHVSDRQNRPSGTLLPFARFRKNQLVRNTSSGSTGAPTVFYEDGSRTAVNWAHELRLRSWFGVPPGVREARMARISSEYLPWSRGLRLRRHLWNQLVLPGINLGTDEYQICYDRLKEFQPRILWGFTSALAGLAEHIRERGLDPVPIKPDLIISWAAPLYEHEEKVLRDVFNSAVTNIYGAREVGHFAMRCPEGSFHINEEYLLVEQEINRLSTGGGAGELLVTTLDTTIMPFIRYRMGDIGSISRDKCSCGRTLQTLENLLGRTGEVFTTKDGRMISPNFWCRTFMNPALSEKIVRFQVIYKARDDIRIILVKGNGFKQNTEDELYRFLRDNFSEDIKISFQYTDEIKPRISGKYQMVVNEMETRS